MWVDCSRPVTVQVLKPTTLEKGPAWSSNDTALRSNSYRSSVDRPKFVVHLSLLRIPPHRVSRAAFKRNQPFLRRVSFQVCIRSRPLLHVASGVCVQRVCGSGRGDLQANEQACNRKPYAAEVFYCTKTGTFCPAGAASKRHSNQRRSSSIGSSCICRSCIRDIRGSLYKRTIW